VDGAVDLSTIPLALVQRIEVLKDGASAIYGSDAIGGVINIITRRDYSGAELNLYAGGTDHGDGRSRHADFSFGRSGEKWNAAFAVEWGDDDPIMAEDRAISSVGAPGLPPDATGSSATQYGYYTHPGGRGRFVLIAGRPGTSPDDFRPYDPAVDRNYNYVPYNYLQTPQQRRAAFGQFRREFSPTLAFSADALFNQRRSAQQLAPPVVGFSSANNAGTPDGFDVSPQNVYNPFGGPISVFTRWPDSTPRRFEQSVDTTRFKASTPRASISDWMDCCISSAATGAGTQMPRAHTPCRANSPTLMPMTRSSSSRSVLRSTTRTALPAAARRAT